MLLDAQVADLVAFGEPLVVMEVVFLCLDIVGDAQNLVRVAGGHCPERLEDLLLDAPEEGDFLADEHLLGVENGQLCAPASPEHEVSVERVSEGLELEPGWVTAAYARPSRATARGTRARGPDSGRGL